MPRALHREQVARALEQLGALDAEAETHAAAVGQLKARHELLDLSYETPATLTSCKVEILFWWGDPCSHTW